MLFRSPKELERIAFINNDPAHKIYAQSEVAHLLCDICLEQNEVSFEGEDCLSGIEHEINLLLKGERTTKKQLKNLLSVVDDIQLEISQRADHAKQEHTDLIKRIYYTMDIMP